jgi:TolB-like protein
MSRDEENEYFSDGLAEELMNMLSKIRGLRVAARASSFHFKGKNPTIGEVGSTLNVATVLSGSVRKSANRVRISVQLVKVTDGYQLWSETFERTLDDIFAVHDEVARAVVTALPGELAKFQWIDLSKHVRHQRHPHWTKMLMIGSGLVALGILGVSVSLWVINARQSALGSDDGWAGVLASASIGFLAFLAMRKRRAKRRGRSTLAARSPAHPRSPRLAANGRGGPEYCYPVRIPDRQSRWARQL